MRSQEKRDGHEKQETKTHRVDTTPHFPLTGSTNHWDLVTDNKAFGLAAWTNHQESVRDEACRRGDEARSGGELP